MVSQADIFSRSSLLLGPDAVKRLAEQRVLLVGVGGVGSWCAEGLIRTGIQHLTIVDSDEVCASNINRQLMATTATIGQVKVEALRERLLLINPQADIITIHQTFTSENSADFHLEQYDYIIDCIDSLRDKIHLLVEATRSSKARVYSSMGAAQKLDPTRIQVAEFWKVKGCPLGAAMRTRMRHDHLILRKKVTCVFSEERIPNRGITSEACPDHRAQVCGSIVPITAIYGFTLAGLIIKHICDQAD